MTIKQSTTTVKKHTIFNPKATNQNTVVNNSYHKNNKNATKPVSGHFLVVNPPVSIVAVDILLLNSKHTSMLQRNLLLDTNHSIKSTDIYIWLYSGQIECIS